jgi:hypothetical protein
VVQIFSNAVDNLYPAQFLLLVPMVYLPIFVYAITKYIITRKQNKVLKDIFSTRFVIILVLIGTIFSTLFCLQSGTISNVKNIYTMQNLSITSMQDEQIKQLYLRVKDLLDMKVNCKQDSSESTLNNNCIYRYFEHVNPVSDVWVMDYTNNCTQGGNIFARVSYYYKIVNDVGYILDFQGDIHNPKQVEITAGCDLSIVDIRENES